MKKEITQDNLKNIASMYNCAEDAYSYIPENFDYSNLIIKDNLNIFDKIEIFFKDDVEFWRDEFSYEESWDGKDLRFLIGKTDTTTGIILPRNDIESGYFDIIEYIVCLKWPCPKEGAFYNYIPMVSLIQNELIEAIFKVQSK